MKKEEKKYFWNLKNENFGGRGFGADVTDLLENQPERRAELLRLGKIVTSEPIDFDHAKESELNSLRTEVERLQSRNSEVEAELKKSASSKLKESREKISELEAQLEEATAPEKPGDK